MRSQKGCDEYDDDFQRGEKSSSWYGTPVGDVQLGIEVTDMQLMEGEDEIEMNVAYALENEQRACIRFEDPVGGSWNGNKGLFRI